MRIWSLHPKYLDRQGLLACWRETLLAQKVISGETKGYRNHPQLFRFRTCPDPLAAVATYLVSLAAEAKIRGYDFNLTKITPGRVHFHIPVTQGQILYEWKRLKEKLTHRDPYWLSSLNGIEIPDIHPLFILIDGEVEQWEKVH